MESGAAVILAYGLVPVAMYHRSPHAHQLMQANPRNPALTGRWLLACQARQAGKAMRIGMLWRVDVAVVRDNLYR